MPAAALRYCVAANKNWPGTNLRAARILRRPARNTDPPDSPLPYPLGDSPLSPTARVLIVDRSRESRDLLCSLLSRSGAEVIEARGTDRGAEMAAEERPDLIVVDAEAAQTDDGDASAARLAAAAARNACPIVVLGTFRRCASPLPTEQFVAKPYHYGALIRRIEELLGHRL
jgi:CheY-like chemotaxis protein